MKVLMTADTVGGVWTYALELSAALADHGVAVLLATMGPRPCAAQYNAARAIPNLTLECSDYALEWMTDPWRDVQQAGAWLQEIAARECVDIVHVNGYVHAALPWRQPVLSVAHSCVCSWWSAVHHSLPPALWDTYREKVAEGLARADHVVAPTQAFLDEMQRIYGRIEAASVIHNARSAQLFATAPAGGRLPIIFACGRLWDEAKSVAVLDAAARNLPWHVYMAGDSVAPGGARVRAHALRALGSLPARDVAAWLQRAAIFAHPSKYEPFGLAVLEAALAGCPLVLADLPTLRELWDGAAEFVDCDDAAALKRLLRALIAQPARRAALSAAAQSRARRYRPENMSAAYLAVYRKLLATKQRQERAVA